MIQAIRAELRKLATVRATYVIIGLCLLITVFFAFYIEGFRVTRSIRNPGLLASEIIGAAQSIGLLIALAGVLLMAQEYRYNTIMYTLTAARSRLQVLVAKIVVVTLFSVLLALLLCIMSPLLTKLGLQTHHIAIVPQNLPLLSLLARGVLYVWGYAMIALIIATIVRSQIGIIAFLFLFPTLGETLLTLVLKKNAVYLPFNALSSELRDGPAIFGGGQLSHSHAAALIAVYIVVGWLIAATLFVKRDAN